MDYYTLLLQSYDKIKQRKFTIISEASRMAPEATATALKYLKLAHSKASSDNYVVPIPELGGDARIFVARGSEVGGKASKHSGKVVVQNVLGFQAMPVGDEGGNPLNNTTWNHFVGKFNRVLGSPDVSVAMADMSNQPTQPMPSMNPSPHSMFMDKAARNLVNLAQSGRFFRSHMTMMANEWEKPGPLGDFPVLTQSIFGPNPTSIESKITNGLELWTDEKTKSKFFKPLENTKKKIVGEIFLEFTNKINKLYDNSFTDEDAKFISDRIMSDRNGIWIKDPVHLEEGVALCWRNSKTDPQTKLMLSLVNNYNKAYGQWCQERNTPPKYNITSSPISLTRKKDVGDLNYIRGETSEDMIVIIHLISTQQHEQAAQYITKVVNEYDKQIKYAYDSVIPFWEGTASADKTLIDIQGTIEELDKLSPERKKGDTFVRRANPRDRKVVMARRLLPKIAIFEGQAMFARNPKAVDKTSGRNQNIGYKADIEEYYDSPEDVVSVLREVYGYDESDLQEFAQSNTLRVGVKHYLEEGTFTLTKGSIDAFHANMRSNHPFIDQSLMVLNVTKEEVMAIASEIDTVYNGINLAFTDKQVMGYSSDELNNSNIKVLFDKIRSNCNYEDLLDLKNMESMDLKDKETKKGLKMFLQKKVVLSTIQKNCNQRDALGALTPRAQSYRKYLAALIYSEAGSEIGQIQQFRSFDTGRQYIVNHNKALRLALADFIDGKSILDTKDPRLLKIVDPEKGYFTLQCRLVKNDNRTKMNTLEIQISRDYIRSLHTPSRIKIKESVELKIEKLLKKLLEISL